MSARASAPRAAFLALLGALALAPVAHAHKPSDGHLSLDVVGSTVTGHVELAVRDLHVPLSLDPSGDGAITWGELRARAPTLLDYVHARLRFTEGEAVCPATLGALQVTRRDGQAHVRLPVRADCGRAIVRLGVGYGLFAELDPTHRGLLRLTAMGTTRSAVLTPATAMPARMFDFGAAASTFATRFVAGARSVLLGLEPLLLLSVLLLPVVGLRRGRRGAAQLASPVGAPSETAPRQERFAWPEVGLLLLVFFSASALTMVLSATRLVSPPARWVECAVALSVLLAALANLFALANRRRWSLALLLGLVHGFGLSKQLALQLGGDIVPAASIAALVLGVASGLAVACLAMSSLGVLRGTWAYRRIVLGGGSAAVAVIATFWAVERLFDVPIWSL